MVLIQIKSHMEGTEDNTPDEAISQTGFILLKRLH